MTPINPFSARISGGPPPRADEAAFAVFGVVYAAEAVWDLLGALPNQAEATLARRRLQEAVFWAERAAE